MSSFKQASSMWENKAKATAAATAAVVGGGGGSNAGGGSGSLIGQVGTKIDNTDCSTSNTPHSLNNDTLMKLKAKGGGGAIVGTPAPTPPASEKAVSPTRGKVAIGIPSETAAPVPAAVPSAHHAAGEPPHGILVHNDESRKGSQNNTPSPKKGIHFAQKENEAAKEEVDNSKKAATPAAGGSGSVAARAAMFQQAESQRNFAVSPVTPVKKNAHMRSSTVAERASLFASPPTSPSGGVPAPRGSTSPQKPPLFPISPTRPSFGGAAAVTGGTGSSHGVGGVGSGSINNDSNKVELSPKTSDVHGGGGHTHSRTKTVAERAKMFAFVPEEDDDDLLSGTGKPYRPSPVRRSVGNEQNTGDGSGSAGIVGPPKIRRPSLEMLRAKEAGGAVSDMRSLLIEAGFVPGQTLPPGKVKLHSDDEDEDNDDGDDDDKDDGDDKSDEDDDDEDDDDIDDRPKSASTVKSVVRSNNTTNATAAAVGGDGVSGAVDFVAVKEVKPIPPPPIYRTNPTAAHQAAATKLITLARVLIARGVVRRKLVSEVAAFGMVMEKGIRVIKHPFGSKAKPKAVTITFVRKRTKHTSINMVKKGGDMHLLWGGRGAGIRLEDIYGVVKGIETNSLKRTADAKRTDHCFSLLTRQRTVDFEVYNPWLVLLVVRAIRLYLGANYSTLEPPEFFSPLHLRPNNHKRGMHLRDLTRRSFVWTTSNNVDKAKPQAVPVGRGGGGGGGNRGGDDGGDDDDDDNSSVPPDVFSPEESVVSNDDTPFTPVRGGGGNTGEKAAAQGDGDADDEDDDEDDDLDTALRIRIHARNPTGVLNPEDLEALKGRTFDLMQLPSSPTEDENRRHRGAFNRSVDSFEGSLASSTTDSQAIVEMITSGAIGPGAPVSATQQQRTSHSGGGGGGGGKDWMLSFTIQSAFPVGEHDSSGGVGMNVSGGGGGGGGGNGAPTGEDDVDEVILDDLNQKLQALRKLCVTEDQRGYGKKGGGGGGGGGGKHKRSATLAMRNRAFFQDAFNGIKNLGTTTGAEGNNGGEGGGGSQVGSGSVIGSGGIPIPRNSITSGAGGGGAGGSGGLLSSSGEHYYQSKQFHSPAGAASPALGGGGGNVDGDLARTHDWEERERRKMAALIQRSTLHKGLR